MGSIRLCFFCVGTISFNALSCVNSESAHVSMLSSMIQRVFSNRTRKCPMHKRQSTVFARLPTRRPIRIAARQQTLPKRLKFAESNCIDSGDPVRAGKVPTYGAEAPCIRCPQLRPQYKSWPRPLARLRAPCHLFCSEKLEST